MVPSDRGHYGLKKKLVSIKGFLETKSHMVLSCGKTTCRQHATNCIDIRVSGNRARVSLIDWRNSRGKGQHPLHSSDIFSRPAAERHNRDSRRKGVEEDLYSV